MYDLTLPIREGMLSPGGEGFRGFELRRRKRLERDGVESTAFCMTAHDGTHTDAPAHYLADGRTIDQLRFDEMTGPARVFDLREHAGELIDAAALETADPGIEPGERVLLITGDIDAVLAGERGLEYPGDVLRESAALSADAADWLVDKGVKQVANDFVTESLRVSTRLVYDPERPVHMALLGADISIVEYLCNTGTVVGSDRIRLDCYPLGVAGTEAAPTRVVAER